MVTALSKHPETYSELLARSLRLYRQVLPRTFLFALLVAIILFIPRLICVAVGKNVFLIPGQFNSQLLLYLTIYVSTLWFLAAILWCINCIQTHKHKNFVDDVRMAGKRILYVIGAGILLSLVGVVTGFCAYILHCLFWFLNLYSYNNYLTDTLVFLVLLAQVGVSVYISTLFYFYFPLIVIEKEGIILALNQSALLVWGRIWKTICLQVTPWFCYLITLIVIKMVFKVNIVIYFMPVDPVSNFYPTVLHILIFAFFIPWGCALMLTQLGDLELRKEKTLKKK